MESGAPKKRHRLPLAGAMAQIAEMAVVEPHAVVEAVVE
jgi:hypothetical protein